MPNNIHSIKVSKLGIYNFNFRQNPGHLILKVIYILVITSIFKQKWVLTFGIDVTT